MVLWAQEPMEDKTFGNDCAGILDPKILMEKVKLKAAGATSVSDMLSTNICNESISEWIDKNFLDILFLSAAKIIISAVQFLFYFLDRRAGLQK